MKLPVLSGNEVIKALTKPVLKWQEEKEDMLF